MGAVSWGRRCDGQPPRRARGRSDGAKRSAARQGSLGASVLGAAVGSRGAGVLGAAVVEGRERVVKGGVSVVARHSDDRVNERDREDVIHGAAQRAGSGIRRGVRRWEEGVRAGRVEERQERARAESGAGKLRRFRRFRRAVRRVIYELARARGKAQAKLWGVGESGESGGGAGEIGSDKSNEPSGPSPREHKFTCCSPPGRTRACDCSESRRPPRSAGASRTARDSCSQDRERPRCAARLRHFETAVRDGCSGTQNLPPVPPCSLPSFLTLPLLRRNATATATAGAPSPMPAHQGPPPQCRPPRRTLPRGASSACWWCSSW